MKVESGKLTHTNWSINKSIMWLGIAGIGGLIVWKMISAWQKNAPTRAIENALDKSLDINKASITISDADAILYANKLQNAMDGYGTDEDAIKDILLNKPFSANDLKLIVQKFGIKKYGYTGIAWLGGSDLDLTGWLKEELSGDLLDAVKSKFQQAGINW